MMPTMAPKRIKKYKRHNLEVIWEYSDHPENEKAVDEAFNLLFRSPDQKNGDGEEFSERD